MSTAKKFAGQTAIYGISTIASRVLTFIMTPVYTRAYALGANGIITTMYSYVSMTNALLSFGMETTFFRYLNKHADNKQRVYNNAFASVVAVTVLFLLFTLPFIGHIASFIDIDHAKKITSGKPVLGSSPLDFLKYTYLFLAIVVVDAWCAIPFVKLRADGKPGRYGAIKLASVLIFVGFNLVFIYLLPFWIRHNLAAAGWISGWYVPKWVGYVFISELLSSIVTLLLLLPELAKIKLQFDKDMLLSMYSYSWPVLIANLSYLVNENMDKILLGKELSTNVARDVGIYGACAKIAVFLSVFVNAFRLGAEPFFFNQAKNKNAGQTYARIMDYFVIAVCIIFVGLVANIEIIKYLWVTPQYWPGLRVVPPLLFGYVSLGIYMNLSIWYKLSDQTKYGLYISGIGAIITIAFNLLFIPKYSYMASAWTSLLAYTVMMLLSYVWGQKNYPIPYNVKKNGLYIISAIIIVYVITQVNSNYSDTIITSAATKPTLVFDKGFLIGDVLLLAYVLMAFYFERANLKAIFKR